MILPLLKKGDRWQCSNYRGISLIDIMAKVFVSLLLRHFQVALDAHTRRSQCGLRPGRGCVDQIFNLRRTLEHRGCFQQPSVICFVDFVAAFDSIDRTSLWTMMKADGFPPPCCCDCSRHTIARRSPGFEHVASRPNLSKSSQVSVRAVLCRLHGSTSRSTGYSGIPGRL